MWFKVRVQLHSFACDYPVFPMLLAEKIVISLLNDLGILIKNHLRPWFISALSILFHWPTCVFLHQYQNIFNLLCFVVSFKIRKCSPPTLFFFKSVFGRVLWDSKWILGRVILFLQKMSLGFLQDFLHWIHRLLWIVLAS